MKISEAINKAIETRLSKTDPFGWSCLAVEDACDNVYVAACCMSFLRRLGLNTNSENAFDEFPAGPKRQMARAIWLTWAAMIAEEEGL